MDTSEPEMPSIRKVAFFGGTFDPPHNGHLGIVKYILEHTGLDRILIVPSFSPPHKDSNVATFEERMEMCRILFSEELNDRRVELSRVEETLPSPSYTWQTMEFIGSQEEGAELFIVVGMDNYRTLDSWKKGDELQHRYRFIVLARREGGDTGVKVKDIVMTNPLWEISSEKIRELFGLYYKQGGDNQKIPLSKMLPEKLLDYILQKGLYRNL